MNALIHSLSFTMSQYLIPHQLAHTRAYTRDLAHAVPAEKARFY